MKYAPGTAIRTRIKRSEDTGGENTVWRKKSSQF